MSGMCRLRGYDAEVVHVAPPAALVLHHIRLLVIASQQRKVVGPFKLASRKLSGA